MKFYLVLSLILSLTYYVQGEADSKLVLEDCLDQLNVPISEMERYQQLADPETVVEKCVFECITTFYGVIRDKQVSLSGLKKWLKPEESDSAETRAMLNKVVDICYKENKNIVSDENCELGVKIRRCVQENMKVLENSYITPKGFITEYL